MKARSKSSRGGLKIHRSHLCIKKDLVFDGTLYVAGNLEVHGNLRVGALHCVGSVRVHGDISAGDLVIGSDLTCKGDLKAEDVEVGCKDFESFVEDYRSGAVLGIDSPRMKNWVSDELLLELQQARNDLLQEQSLFEFCLVTVGGDLSCDVATVAGGVMVNGALSVKSGVIHGSADVGSLYCYETLDIDQHLDIGTGDYRSGPRVWLSAQLYMSKVWVGGNISCKGNFYGHIVKATSLIIYGDCDLLGNLILGESLEVMGKVLCEGDISAGEYIKVGGLLASKMSITAGADYGIFSGLNIARSQWPYRGYICAAIKPKNILSGLYMTRKQKRPWKDQNKERKGLIS